MKKKRHQRPVSPLLTPAEVDQILTEPRIHLDLLLRKEASLSQLQTIAGLLNLGTGLGSIKGDPVLTEAVQGAVSALTLAAGANPPALLPENRQPFLRVIMQLETLLRITPRHLLVAAMQFVHKSMENGTAEIRRVSQPGAPVVQLPPVEAPRDIP